MDMLRPYSVLARQASTLRTDRLQIILRQVDILPHWESRTGELSVANVGIGQYS